MDVACSSTGLSVAVVDLSATVGRTVGAPCAAWAGALHGYRALHGHGGLSYFRLERYLAMTYSHDDLDDAQWRDKRIRRQRYIAVVVIMAMALPGGLALWSLLN